MKTVAKSKEDFEKVLGSIEKGKCGEQEFYPCNRQYLIENFGYPNSYPCQVHYSHKTIEVDDVGMGFESVIEMRFVYKKDIENTIKGLQEELKQMED